MRKKSRDEEDTIKSYRTVAFASVLITSIFATYFLFWGTEKEVDFTRGEQYHYFGVEIKVLPDGRMSVFERFQVKSEGRKIKHGVTRELLTNYFDYKGEAVRPAYTIIRTAKEGKQIKYPTERKERGAGTVFFGFKDKPLQKGLHTYSFNYEVREYIVVGEDFYEIYWPVTGRLPFPVQQAYVSLELPASVDRSKAEIFGWMKDNKQNPISAVRKEGRALRRAKEGADVSFKRDGSILIRTKHLIRPYDSFAVVVRIPKFPIVEVARPAARAEGKKDKDQDKDKEEGQEQEQVQVQDEEGGKEEIKGGE